MNYLTIPGCINKYFGKLVTLRWIKGVTLISCNRNEVLNFVFIVNLELSKIFADINLKVLKLQKKTVFCDFQFAVYCE